MHALIEKVLAIYRHIVIMGLKTCLRASHGFSLELDIEYDMVNCSMMIAVNGSFAYGHFS